ncbi:MULTISPECIES: NAD(P)/FAD-dependent oxidoreductase [Thermofilum]|uniref:Thioredoxin reductase n=1 Tax=Thermofilum adornatum 1505 TaxID=697581 RepID=A0A3G1A7W4_9CREN|nr:FAD-dependent oxidoreductase [Thermofilum adornatum]AJB42343.1 Thioredoxin reductase [Thermofilum adornatum 1505]
MKKYDVIIVGAGIAGLTAALYAARQKLSTLVISADLGGQLLLTNEIQNFPGFMSISGLELIRKVEEQAKTYGAEILFDEVTSIAEQENLFTVKTASGNEFQAEAVVLAFGKSPKEMGVPGEKELKGKGVSYCVICDAPLYRGKRVVLVGWGLHNYENIVRLRDYASKVYWVFPGEKPLEEEELLQEAMSKGNVELVPFSEPVEVKGDKRVQALVVRNKKTGELKTLEVDGVFVEMGYVTKTDFLKGLVQLNEKGEIVVDKMCRTSKPGIFAAGDVSEMPHKQAVIAAGMGACAALSAYAYVMEKRGRKVGQVADWRHVEILGKKKEGAGLSIKLR